MSKIPPECIKRFLDVAHRALDIQSVRHISGSWFEITSTYHAPDGDALQVYAWVGHRDQVLLTDDGETLNGMSFSGIRLSDDDMRHIDALIKASGAYRSGGRIHVRTTLDHLGVAERQIMQAMLAVGQWAEQRRRSSPALAWQ